MTDLERALTALAGDVSWPTTPEPAFRLAARERRDLRRPAFAALALAVAALAVAFAVPSARSAILHFFRIGSARIERVGTLPAAQERPLAALLGSPLSRSEAREVLGAPVHLPAGVQIHITTGGFLSGLVSTPDGPVLASEIRSLPAAMLVKKVATEATRIEPVSIRPGTPGFWLSGGPHLVLEPAPARLAGDVLLWEDDRITYRLEGRDLRLPTAIAVARQIDP